MFNTQVSIADLKLTKPLQANYGQFDMAVKYVVDTVIWLALTNNQMVVHKVFKPLGDTVGISWQVRVGANSKTALLNSTRS